MTIQARLRNWKYGDGNNRAARKLRIEAADEIDALTRDVTMRENQLLIADKQFHAFAKADALAELLQKLRDEFDAALLAPRMKASTMEEKINIERAEIWLEQIDAALTAYQEKGK